MREKVNRRFSCFSQDLRKRGAVEWSVGKLMSIVLLIVVLALVVYGVSSGGLMPLFERANSSFNEVLLFFGVGDDDDSGDGECAKSYSVNIVDVGDGMLTKCRLGCEFVLDVKDNLKFADLNSKLFKYNMKNGVMNDGGIKDDGQWYSFNQNYLGLDIEKIELYREIYSELNGSVCELSLIHI